MEIQGLQKMTLLDYPGKVACTVFLSGCNYRCPFCHNSELLDASTPGIMNDEELLTFLDKRVGILEGVAFTGGEPLMRKELPDLLLRVKELGYPVKLDTNGAFPDALESVVRAGLVDYVAMDIKNSPDRYAETCGLADMGYLGENSEDPLNVLVRKGSLLEKVQRSKNFLITAGKGAAEGLKPLDFEFRTTTVAELHDADSFRKIGPWIRGAKAFFLQPFTDRDTVAFSGLSAPTDGEMTGYAEQVRPYVDSVKIRGQL